MTDTITDGPCDTIGAALALAESVLQPLGEHAPVEARRLVAAALRLPVATTVATAERVLTDAEQVRLRDWLRRRAAGQPLAYLRGEKEFWSLPLLVDPNVLVPRPETELVVERALALGTGSGLQVLDLGTGSGAIAAALARERRDWQITAVERSDAARAVAAKNFARLTPGNVELLPGEWFDALGERQFDMVLSNPPYLAANDSALHDDGVRAEPREALVAGASGMEALFFIIANAPMHLRDGGWLILEHGGTQQRTVADALANAGFAHVRCHADLAGWPRVSEGRLQGTLRRTL
ncbi:MAG: peptide chain release factor N(5)-glutamine methyltransferase [Steroidobacteraceae bacterium]